MLKWLGEIGLSFWRLKSFCFSFYFFEKIIGIKRVLLRKKFICRIKGIPQQLGQVIFR